MYHQATTHRGSRSALWAVTKVTSPARSCPRCGSPGWAPLRESGPLGEDDSTGSLGKRHYIERWHCSSCGIDDDMRGSLVRISGVHPPWRRGREFLGRVIRPKPDRSTSLRRPPFPLYGLPTSWTGTRYMAGWSGRRGSIRGISLGHVRSLEAQERAPVLEVGIGPELRMEPESFDSQSWDRLPLVADGQPVIFDRTKRAKPGTPSDSSG